MSHLQAFPRSRPPRGFTLVEMLVVIGIIAILIALLIPTIGIVNRKVRLARMSLEVKQIDQAVEQYKNDHGDYPPDFADIRVAERHIRKAFPRIHATEWAILRRSVWVPDSMGNLIRQIDSAEALYFWLGGLSNDPRHPFSGKGGPLKVLSSGQVVANPERNKGIFEFDHARLSTYIADPMTKSPDPNGQMLSSDEGDLHGSAANNDPFPVYYPKGQTEPYVYFDRRTYTVRTSAGFVRNFWRAAAVNGVARPYRSDQRNPNRNPADTSPGSFLFYANREKFQIICAGLDGDYGTGNGRYNSGDALSEPPVGSGYAQADLDNLTNFSDGRSLGDARP